MGICSSSMTEDEKEAARKVRSWDRVVGRVVLAASSLRVNQRCSLMSQRDELVL